MSGHPANGPSTSGQPKNIVVAAGGGTWESTALEFVQSASRLGLARRCVDAVDLMASAPDIPDAVALVDPDLTGLDADVVWRLLAAHTKVFLVCATHDDFDRISAWAATLGATGVVRDNDLHAILVDSRPDEGRPGTSAGGQVIAVWGPAGAPGRTTAAIGLADYFAKAAPEDVLLIDADPYGGAVAPVLGVLDEVSGLLAAIRAAGNGSPDAVVNAAYRVAGIDVLTGLPHAQMWMNARPAGFDKVLQTAPARWSTTIIDTGFCLEDNPTDPLAARRNQLTRLALESADHIVVCGSADPVGLSRLVRGVHELREEIPTCRPIIVVNRFRRALGWKRAQIAETIHRLTGVRPDVFVPYDLASLDAALIEGRMISETAPRSDLLTAFAAIGALCGRIRDVSPVSANAPITSATEAMQ